MQEAAKEAAEAQKVAAAKKAAEAKAAAAAAAAKEAAVQEAAKEAAAAKKAAAAKIAAEAKAAAAAAAAAAAKEAAALAVRKSRRAPKPSMKAAAMRPKAMCVCVHMCMHACVCVYVRVCVARYKYSAYPFAMPFTQTLRTECMLLLYSNTAPLALLFPHHPFRCVHWTWNFCLPKKKTCFCLYPCPTHR